LKIRKRYYLKKKKLKGIIDKLGYYSKLISPKSRIEILDTDHFRIILINGEPFIMMIGDTPFPTLKGALEIPLLYKYVTVDMGAVKFVAKGADVMCPGIIDADLNIKEDDLVIVVDELHKKPLAIGKSLISGEDMINRNEGKAVKSIHHIGDKIWNLSVK
jgi:PUA-domain protein